MIDTEFIPGVPVHLGAEIVHGNDNLLMELARKYGLVITQTFTWAHGDGGPSDDPSPSGGVGYYYVGATRRLHRYDNLPKELKRLHELLWGLSELPLSDPSLPRSLKAYLESEAVPPELVAMACAGYANTAGSTAAELDLRHTIVQERQWSTDGDHDFLVHPSMLAVLRELAKGTDIRTNWPVSRVAYPAVGARAGAGAGAGAGASVEVVCSNGAKLAASAVVVTVPPPVLRNGDIEFVPPLAQARVDALHRVQFSNGAKVHLLFSERVWPSDADGVIFSDCFVPEMWFRSGRLPSGAGAYHLVTCFAMGSRADAIAALPDAVAIARALSQVCDVFDKDAHTKFVKGSCFAWSNVPHIRGAYTCSSVKERDGDRVTMAQPHGARVFFAGEATAGHQGQSAMTLHGTLESGIKVAHDVIKMLAVAPSARL